jgi:hypothetical protein
MSELSVEIGRQLCTEVGPRVESVIDPEGNTSYPYIAPCGHGVQSDGQVIHDD